MTNRQVIELCKRASVHWEGPDMCDFMGQFEATTMDQMRAIIAQARAELIAEMEQNVLYWQDPDNPLALPGAVRRVGWLPLAAIPKA